MKGIAGLLLVFILMAPSSYGQSHDYYKEIPPFRNCFYYGFNKHTLGWGLNFRMARNLQSSRYILYDLDIASLKHPKELKVINPAFENPRPYVYGKLHRNMVVRLGTGFKKILADRSSKNSIAVALNYSLGPELAIMKPVYLDIVTIDSATQRQEVTREKFNPGEPPNQKSILGYSPFRQGINELSARAGMYMKAGVSFEFGSYSADLKVLEAGMILDFFPGKLPLLAYIDNKSLFVSGFVSFSFGNKH